MAATRSSPPRHRPTHRERRNSIFPSPDRQVERLDGVNQIDDTTAAGTAAARIRSAGASGLSDDELLRTLLHGGEADAENSRRDDVAILRDEFDTLRALDAAGFDDIERHFGYGSACAARVAVAFELARRLARQKLGARPRFSNSRDIFDFVALDVRELKQEVFEVLALDAKNRLLKRQRVFVGTLTGSLVHPREVFRVALEACAAAIVVLHNHPSGDPNPSREDIDVTHRLSRAGEIIGVRLLDHLIIGDGRYVSLADSGSIVPHGAVPPRQQTDTLETDTIHSTSRRDELEAKKKGSTMKSPKPAVDGAYRLVKTRLGWTAFVLGQRGLKRSYLPCDDDEALRAVVRGDFPALAEKKNLAPDVAKQFREFFAGKRREFDVEIDMGGVTAFQRRVYERLGRIPWGETCTYAELAEMAGSPGAARGVGSAMARNPVPPVLPCHRVLGSDGRLRGFSAVGGIDLKKRMLELEAG